MIEQIKQSIQKHKEWVEKHPLKNVFLLGFVLGFIVGAILC
jgi:hypothetical protein